MYAGGVKLFIVFAIGLAVGVPVGLGVASFAPNAEVNESKRKIDELSKALDETVADLKSTTPGDGKIVEINPAKKPEVAAPIQTADLSRHGLPVSRKQIIGAIQSVLAIKPAAQKTKANCYLYEVPAGDVLVEMEGGDDGSCDRVTILTGAGPHAVAAVAHVQGKIAQLLFGSADWYVGWIGPAIQKSDADYQVTGSRDGVNVDVSHFELFKKEMLMITFRPVHP